MSPGQEGEGPGLPAVAAAATALVSGVGALTLTGALGRVQRNSGEALVVALAFVVVGAAVWVGGAMVSTKARRLSLRGRHVGVREIVRGLGMLLSISGLILGFRAAINTADDTEQPAVALKLSTDQGSVSGTAKVANLSSKGRLNVYVDGLVRVNGRYQTSAALYQAFVGPNGDGDATTTPEVRVPPDRFDAVGIRAFTAQHPEACGGYPRNTKQAGETGTGCAIIQLSPPARRTLPPVKGAPSDRE